MGKPYSQELAALRRTYEWAAGVPLADLRHIIRQSGGLPLYAVGSGGSLTVAAFAAALHRQAGTTSTHMTPLEFIELESLHPRSAVLLVTAGGNNNDILAALRHAASLDPAVLCVVCADETGRITSEAERHHAAWSVSRTPPTNKDGFLATNTTICMMAWLARAYAHVLPPADQMFHATNMVGDFVGRDHIIILYDSWGKPAALDMESKLHESGLAGAHLADWRNFAHGRHNWLVWNRERTGIISMATPRCSRVAAGTLGVLPAIPTVKLATTFDGPAASIDLTIQGMYVVESFGRMSGVDPGRPKVAAFGRKLYGMKIGTAGTNLTLT